MDSNPPQSDPSSGAPQEPTKLRARRRWLKIGAWIACGLATVLLLIVATTAIVVRSAQFHNYVLSTLEQQASARLGANVQLQNFEVHLASLSADLYGLTISGAPPYPNPPLLEVRHIAVGVRIVSIFHKNWYLDNLRIDDPVVRVFTASNGISNLPTMKSSGAGSNTSVFDLAVRHVVLEGGEAYYNDRASSIAADLHDLEFNSSFDALAKRYSGSISYRDGHLTAGTFRPIPHGLVATFDATPSTFHLTSAKLVSGPSQLMLNATVTDYSQPLVQAQYVAELDGNQLRQILDNPSLPVGAITAKGTFDYRAIPNRPALQGLTVDGTLESRRLDVRANGISAGVQDIYARYSLKNDDATVDALKARLLGGELDATAKMSNLGGDSHAAGEASLRGVSLEAVRRMFPAAAMPRGTTLSGTMNAQTKVNWGKDLNSLVAHADVAIQGRLAERKAAAGTQALPIESAIHGTYSASTGRLELVKSYLRMPQTSLTMNGTVSKRSSLSVALQANDLGEIATVSEIFLPASSSSVSASLAGKATFLGKLQGSMSAPRLTGQLTASGLRLNGTSWRSLRANLDVSPSGLGLANGSLQSAGQGNVSFSGRVGLKRWSFNNTSPIQVTVTASHMELADLEKLADQRIPLSGSLSANIKVSGSESAPSGTGDVSLTHAELYQEPIQLAHLTFTGTGAQVQGGLTLQLPAGSVQSHLTLNPQAKSYVVQVESQGIDLARLQILKSKSIEAKGVVSLSANGEGTFDNPGLVATVRIPQLELQKQTIKQIQLQMNLANRVATANLTSEAVNSSIRANARVELTGQYIADATIDTQAIPLQPLLAVYAPAQAAEFSGETELHLNLHGPLKNKKMLEAHVSIPNLKLAYGSNIQLAAAAPIKADYKDGLLVLQQSEIRGTDTDLKFGGSIPVASSAPMSLMLLGTVNLQLAQLFEPNIRSSGELKFNINSQGAREASAFNGEIQIADANLAGSDLPVSMQHGNGVLVLTQDRLNISKFQATVGGGILTAQGGVAYRPGLRFDLGIAVKNLRMLYPQGLREDVNANLSLGGTLDDALLGGNVELADLSFTPAFDLTNFINQFSGGVAAPPAVGFSQNLRLNVTVHATNDISLVSRTLSVGGTANLQVRGTAAQPVILGRINLNDGDIIFNGDRFVLNGGTIQFVNPSETEPVVNLALTTTIQQYDISMRFNGPIDQLHTDYSSDPSLPAADIINLLAFGQTTEANSANAATPANQQAESLVASQVSSQVTSRISKIAGISQLSISPVLAGGTTEGPPGANITIQQRVTGNLFVTFSTNVATTQNQVIQGQYQLTPRVAISVTRDQNGGVAVDSLIKKTW
jgi:translocation and assembly module TamB